jgi:ADP-heptose:LPS heptosyltransferase
MGWGDDLIWLGEAKHQYLKDGKKRRPTREWVPQPIKEAYLHSPYVDMVGGLAMEERHNQLRPYRWTTDYVLKPAELTLTAEETQLGDEQLSKGNYWIVCPDNKPNQMFGNNRVWGYDNWQRLLELLSQKFPSQRILRLKPPYTKHHLDNVESIDSPGFRYMISVGRCASLIITTDGCWHHIAAAWNKPAVVLWGGTASPYPSEKHKYSGLGYEGQCNIIYKHELTPCYNTKANCNHCKDAWAAITPEFVCSTIEEYTKSEKGFDASP